jgi:hypothetical protein
MYWGCNVFTKIILKVMEKYSQAGQDEFVISLFDEKYCGTFLDIGCRLPNEINNTILLEENGWSGISLDIMDFSDEWKIRTTPFIIEDALKCDYENLFKIHKMPKVIDYLSLDIEGDGLRFLALEKIMKSGVEFKVITIEHDVYRGYDMAERMPQRNLLNGLGYFLVCSNVTLSGNPFEDWWVNPKHISEDKYLKLVSDNLSHYEILKKL